ncbi:hypothetical protein O3M35_004954 [Rhynocoris fuscipes]|uniref:Uncharacterized protein n=1 Tax=Rhynocoris fuscipes TaxID=488301 RepID=A0AAW1DNN6_9HEMI
MVDEEDCYRGCTIALGIICGLISLAALADLFRHELTVFILLEYIGIVLIAGAACVLILIGVCNDDVTLLFIGLILSAITAAYVLIKD